MRVLIINSLYPPLGSGGAERSVEELARALAENGHVVAVATLASPDWRSAPTLGETAYGVRVYRWHPPGPWTFGAKEAPRGVAQRLWWHLRESYRPSARSFIRSVINEFAPDVVNTSNIAGFGVAVLREVQSLPWVHTIRDYYLICPRTTRYKSGGRCGGRCVDCQIFVKLRRLPARSPDEVIGVSRSVLDLHRSLGVWRNSPTSVISNSPAVQPVPFRRVGLIKTVGFIGRIDEPKGVPVLLEAFARPSLGGLNLILAGTVDYEMRAYVEILEEHSRIEVAGVLPAESFYAQVDLVVVPSQWDEPYGRVAAEAASVGLPVVVSDRGGLPEAASSAKRSMIVDEVSEPTAWERAIVHATTVWRDFTVGGLHVDAHGITCEQYVAAYRRAVNRSRDAIRSRSEIE